jgi:hypothetical protein
MSDKPREVTGPSPKGETPLEGEDRKELVGTRAARYPEFDGGLRSDGQNGAGVAQPSLAMQTDEYGVIVKAEANKGTGSDGVPDAALGADVLDQNANDEMQRTTQEASQAPREPTAAERTPAATSVQNAATREAAPRTQSTATTPAKK